MCFLESIQIHNLRECSLFRNMRDCRVHHSIPFRRDIDGYAFLYFISHKLILVIRLQSYTIYLDAPNVSVIFYCFLLSETFQILFGADILLSAFCQDNSQNSPSKTRVFGSGEALGRKYRKNKALCSTL